jgi:hypothetical protein
MKSGRNYPLGKEMTQYIFLSHPDLRIKSMARSNEATTVFKMELAQ